MSTAVVMTPPVGRLQRLSRATAALRHLVRAAWAEDASMAAGIDADLSRMEAEIAALADEAMVAALTRPARTHCHCGAPLPARAVSGKRRAADAETCGSDHCRGVAREAKKLVQRYAARGL